MKLTLFFLLFWTCLTFSKEFQELREIFANEKCKSVTDRQRVLFAWYFRNVNYLKVVDIYDKDEGNIIEKDYVESFVNSSFRNLNMTLILISRNLQSEDVGVSDVESYSRRGVKFRLRATEDPTKTHPTIKAKISRYRSETHFGVVVVVRTLAVLQRFLVGSARTPFHAPRGMFAISLLDDCSKSNSTLLDSIMETMWKDYGISHIIASFTCCDEVISFYDPFEPRFSFKIHSVARNNWGATKQLRIDEEVLEENAALLKAHKQLKGYPLKIVIFRRLPTALLWKELPPVFVQSYFCDAKYHSKEYGAYDGIILGNLLAALNSSIKSIPPAQNVEYGFQLDNGTYTGALGDVVYSHADIAFNSRFVIDYNTSEIEFTSAVYFDKFCVICPKALRIPAALTAFTFFSPLAWVVIVLTNLLFGLVWYFLKQWTCRHKCTSQIYRSMDFTLIETWVLMTSGPLARMPDHLIERIFLTSCLLLSMLETILFQGALTMSFSTVKYYEDINTLHKLVESPLKIGTSSKSLMNIFGQDKAPLTVSLRKKFRFFNNISTINQAANFRNVCCIERAADIKIIMTLHYENPDGSPMLHVVPECPRTYALGYIVRKGWPYLEAVNRVLLQFVEAGLTKKWYTNIEEAFMIDKKLKNAGSYQHEENVLNLEDVQTAYIILAIGFAISTVVFLAELFLFKGYIKSNYF